MLCYSKQASHSTLVSLSFPDQPSPSPTIKRKLPLSAAPAFPRTPSGAHSASRISAVVSKPRRFPPFPSGRDSGESGLTVSQSVVTARGSYAEASRERPLSVEAEPVEAMTESSPKHLVVVGSANADIYLEIQRLPLVGETVSASGGRTLPGGKGANQAACGARLGMPTYFIGQLGEDAYAGLLESALQESGVKTQELRRVGGGVPTGHAVVLLQPGGENSIIIVGGANAAWGKDEEGCFLGADSRRLISTAGAVLLQREVPDQVNLEAAQVAHSAGVPVVLDVGGVEGPISDELLRCLAVLSPNETELLRLTDMPTGNIDQIKIAAKHLLHKGVPRVLVKLGADGSLLLSADKGSEEVGEIRQQVVPAPEVVDTTGAGDTFTAAFGVGIVEGMGDQRALQFASCAASLTVRKKGAMPSLPLRPDVDALCKETFG